MNAEALKTIDFPVGASGVAICVPVLNERESIGALWGRIAIALEGRDWTVVFVDDGSTDGTLAWLEAKHADDPRCAFLRRTKNGPGCQRGAATRAGLEWLLAHTTHGVFVDLDCDGSQRPEELPAGIERVEQGGRDVVIASKYVQGARVLGRSALRRLGSRTYNVMLRALLVSRIRDYSNSYRFYTRAAAELLLRYPASYTTPVYLIEMMAIWLANGLRIEEFPTLYADRVGGSSKVSLADPLRGFAGAWDVGRRYRRGEYARRNSP